MARLVLLVALLSFGCWGSSDEREPARPGAVVGHATSCTQHDPQRVCVTCDGKPHPSQLVLVDGALLWHPSTDRWRLVDEDGASYSWCRE